MNRVVRSFPRNWEPSSFQKSTLRKSGSTHPRGRTGLAVAAAVAAMVWASAASAAEKITYLLPAPPSLPAFAPWVLAKHLGYYTEAGYDVDFVVARGGVDVAKQVGVGNAPIGGAIGDTPVIVRGNGVPVKSVGLMGGGALTVVVGRKDRGITKLEDLKGKKISVLSFQDTTYYALLGALASKGIYQERRERGGGRAGKRGKIRDRRHGRCLRLHA